MQNRLAQQTSPYLRQHADNPVAWQPWDEAALAEAREQSKPILLSIGYSACHWCHVMAHESFEDAEVAALMNRLFVNIKVDREERPDLDKIYQLSHQALTRRAGGWPLTVALDPRTLAPFFAGTYFPKETAYGMPGFIHVLERVAEWYGENRDKLTEQKASLQDVFARIEPEPASGEPDAAPLEAARKEIMLNFDVANGGFSGAPKFPHPASLAFLMDSAATEQDNRPREMALFTLNCMARGGLFDQLGGGFYRYSVDKRWEIPHFEKMLYDNGPLLDLYARAAAITGDGFYRRVARKTAGWVMREMQAPEGGFYSTLDADSAGGEGAFYIWDRDEVENAVGPDDYPLAARRFGLDGEPNFEGRWHLQLVAGSDVIAQAFDLGEEQVAQRLTRAREKMFQAREKRPRPGRDEKILTGWNAQMIEGLSVAGRLLDSRQCLDSAHRALAFIRENLWRDGRLLAVYKDGNAHLAGYLDDYAFLLHALLEWLQGQWHTDDLHWTRNLADALLTHFEDESRGGFYFTAHDHETLLYRPRPFADESTPAGNAVAARALMRLGYLLGETRYLDAAEHTLKAAWNALTAQPIAHTSMLGVLSDYLHPPASVILRGEEKALTEWQSGVNSVYHPGADVYAIPAGEALPGELALREPPQDGAGVVAYICRGTHCSAPIDELVTLQQALSPE
jgi:uncharacterized protein YyaL (SSP411 family)